MEKEAAHDQRDDEDDSVPRNDEQRAALQMEGTDLNEARAETGEGILDHSEHSDAPGAFGTS